MSEQLERIQRMTDEEADKWLDDLHAHIRKQHPHLFDPENTGLSVRGTLLVDINYAPPGCTKPLRSL